jgi:hypothetical protein
MSSQSSRSTTMPAKYNGSYREPIHAPVRGETSVKFLTRRMAKRLDEQDLTKPGVAAFTAWIHRLIKKESIWLAQASYVSFGEIMKRHLYEVFRDEFPGLEQDLRKIEAALFAEFRQLPDFDEPRKAMPNRRPPQRPVLVKDPFKVVS